MLKTIKRYIQGAISFEEVAYLVNKYQLYDGKIDRKENLDSINGDYFSLDMIGSIPKEYLVSINVYLKLFPSVKDETTLIEQKQILNIIHNKPELIDIYQEMETNVNLGKDLFLWLDENYYDTKNNLDKINFINWFNNSFVDLEIDEIDEEIQTMEIRKIPNSLIYQKEKEEINEFRKEI